MSFLLDRDPAALPQPDDRSHDVLSYDKTQKRGGGTGWGVVLISLLFYFEENQRKLRERR